jgi:hypothetical protein
MDKLDHILKELKQIGINPDNVDGVVNISHRDLCFGCGATSPGYVAKTLDVNRHVLPGLIRDLYHSYHLTELAHYLLAEAAKEDREDSLAIQAMTRNLLELNKKIAGDCIRYLRSTADDTWEEWSNHGCW